MHTTKSKAVMVLATGDACKGCKMFSLRQTTRSVRLKKTLASRKVGNQLEYVFQAMCTVKSKP